MFIEYGELSTELYQLTKPIGMSLAGDLEFYRDHLLKTNGKVLEAGVGTGRLLIPFLNAGIDIVGVDVSPQMLRMCRQNCSEHGVETELYEQDLLSLTLPHQFTSIIMPTGSFSLLPGRTAALKVLSLFKEHLKKSGTILIDLELPTNFVPGTSTVHSFPLTQDSGILFTDTALELDWTEQKMISLHRYEKWEQGVLTKSELSQFVLYWYGLKEFESILSDVGYKNIEIIFDYGTSPEYRCIATFIARV